MAAPAMAAEIRQPQLRDELVYVFRRLATIFLQVVDAELRDVGEEPTSLQRKPYRQGAPQCHARRLEGIQPELCLRPCVGV